MPHPEQEHSLMIEVARLRKRVEDGDAAARILAKDVRAWSDKCDELREAVAAARRECEGLRKALSDLIQEMNFGGGCDGNDPSCDGCVAVEAARAALAAPGDGEEGKRGG